jgi:hypothetical protein
MTCLELPVVLCVDIMQGQLEIMQQCMHTHELDACVASALPLCSISIRILCCPSQHWQCTHRATKMALDQGLEGSLDSKAGVATACECGSGGCR